MSASRVGRSALKAAKGQPSIPRTPKSTKASPATKPTRPLPKRANPHLTPNVDTDPTRMSPRVMTILGVTVLGISTYCGFLYASYCREVAAAQALSIPEDVSNRYNHTARTFDGDVALSETLMSIGAKRRDLVSQARGNVLEVSCGTGRNLEYYKVGERSGQGEEGRTGVRGCRSITFTDLSLQMVEVTKGKFEKLYPAFAKSPSVAFRAQDARDVPRPIRESSQGAAKWVGLGSGQKQGYYDTIVQTMGICSMPDPAAALRHLGTITEPQHGRILLLEHGRSHYDWLNRVLDNLAPAHADRHGCWWNRDIGQVVRDSGLEVLQEERYHFGTTWMFVLRPRQGSTLKQDQGQSQSQAQTQTQPLAYSVGLG